LLKNRNVLRGIKWKGGKEKIGIKVTKSEAKRSLLHLLILRPRRTVKL